MPGNRYYSNITLPLFRSSATSAGMRDQLTNITTGFDTVQTEMDLKAPAASPTFTGTPAAPTAALGTSTTQIATTKFVADTAFSSALPSQTGNDGKGLKTDGATATWEDVVNPAGTGSITLTATAITNVTLPTSGTLLSTSTLELAGTGKVTLTAAGTTNITLPTTGTVATTASFPAASQVQMVAAVDNTTRVTPENTKWHPGVAKAWAKIKGDGTAIQASHNVTSITDTATGKVTVTLDTDFSSADYVIVAGGLSVNHFFNLQTTGLTAGAFAVWCQTTTGTNEDPTAYFIACYGTQS